jgi:branched-chain amino acid transport system ATP-binding protein
MSAVLRLDKVSRSFGGLRAVDAVSFKVEEGGITSLIGPNGAGKTTLFNVISGLIPAEEGAVYLREVPITGFKPFQVARLGIGRTFQDPRVFPEMTVLDNVMTGLRQRGEHPLWAVVRGGRVTAEWRAVRERAMQALELVRLAERAGDLAGNLSYGQQRFASIARALVGDPAVVLMDEPTVGLDRRALPRLLELLTEMVSTRGKTVLLIEHNMDVVMAASGSVVLLVEGRVVASGRPEEIRADRKLVEAYLGARHVAGSA